MMRQGPISGAGQQVQMHQAPVEFAEDARVNIDFPLTPDDVRLRSVTMSRLATAGYASGLSGLAMMVLGLVGLGSGAYICLQADADTDTSLDAHNRRWLAYGSGGGMAMMSSAAVTFGLSQVCLGLRKRREAAHEMSSMSVRARFESAATEATRREQV